MRQLEAFLGLLAGLAGLATVGLAVLVLVATLMGAFSNGSVASNAVVEIAADDATETVSEAVRETGDGADATDQALADTAAPTPIASPATAASSAAITVAAGEKVFKKCKACHTVEDGGPNRTGPNLWGVVGRDIATNAEFGYSDDMAAMDGAWEVDLLDRYLTKPKDVVPGTKMTFAGLKKEADRQAVILYLAQQSATPVSAADLGFAGAGAADSADTAEPVAAEEAAEIDEVPYPEGVTYANPPERSAEETARIEGLVAELEALAPTLDYQRARYHPLHFPPAIDTASNEECLVCHQEILDHQPRETSPAGVPAVDTIAWYQTLDTYFGEQQTFHYRHLESDYAKAVMHLQCNFCHKGNDPREESPDMMPGRAAFTASATPEFTLRKMVNPSETCLRCHGAMPDTETIMGFEGPWHVAREDLEWPEAPNGCLSCHAESFRTVRHNVSYLNAANIEELARWGSSDSCYGCHGGRAWYRISYPYPRHEWPLMEDMVGTEVPDWAIGRATASDPAYALPASQ